MKINLYILAVAVVFSTVVIKANAQEDLEKLLNSNITQQPDYTFATFKNTRILNGHSIELLKHKNLEFRISHRFGTLDMGAYNLWGLDQANIHFSLDYGIFDWLNIGVGRGTYEKTFDGFVKFRLMRQSSGMINRPVSVVYISTIAINSLDDPELNHFYTNRLSYCNQILIGRKFNDYFSLQLSPTVVHRNYVATAISMNDLYALGIGGRIKLTKRISFNAEYYYVAKPAGFGTEIINPLSFGFDLETGGHVFQLHLTNSLAMIEKGFIGETTGRWKYKIIHFGFNINRTFAL
ncbi:MAG: DUF5777 family beta-barrel protein [Bacteroidia bacterium]|nr:DUF5777 family beta-barrel protein [Bacteroidia bacterium]